MYTGYNFTDSESIRPYLENPGTGPTSVFCSELAQRLKCYVTAGFPERLEHSDSTTNTPQHLANTHSSSPPVGANSAVLYGPTGKLVSLYRKTNLFETDRTWAIPGDGFTVIDLPPPLGKTTIAICNDLNPKSSGEVCGDGKNGPCELADYCIQEGTGLLVVLAAWDNKAIDIEDEGECTEGQVTLTLALIPIKNQIAYCSIGGRRASSHHGTKKQRSNKAEAI